METIIIDNYDSFTYNLAGYVAELGYGVDVIRNDKFQIQDIGYYDKIILSPGPGIPSEAGLLKQVISEYAHKRPILGVCLGHQAIGEVFGATLRNLTNVYHGVSTPANLFGNDYLFSNIPHRIDVGRYHSWVVDTQNFPNDLEITAMSDDGCIMGLKHKRYDVHGIQFHPESVLTPEGKQIIKNFLSK
ncbi:MAG: aminodeoxychorismate/anthranilate synthase component II [Bacteroidales bacterium]|nr:aminodeoxychorismate/anthranilate synthase component II [Bacteroidales bacterium]